MNKYRIGTDVPFQLSVDDGVEYLDLSNCTILNVAMYCDAQEAFAGACTWALNADDHTRLDCVYPGDRQVYTGIMRAVVIMRTADGEKKTYDLKGIFEIVATTEEANATGETVTSATLSAWQLPMSTLSSIVEAAINATEAATESAIAEISYTASTEDDGINVLHIKQEDGTVHNFNLKNGSKGSQGIQGEVGPRGPQGEQGNTGSSVEYPFELVNNETTDDPTKAHTAAGGKRLKDEITELGQEVGYFYGYTARVMPNIDTNAKTIDLGGDFVLVNKGARYVITNRAVPLYNASAGSSLQKTLYNLTDGTFRVVAFSAVQSAGEILLGVTRFNASGAYIKAYFPFQYLQDHIYIMQDSQESVAAFYANVLLESLGVLDDLSPLFELSKYNYVSATEHYWKDETSSPATNIIGFKRGIMLRLLAGDTITVDAGGQIRPYLFFDDGTVYSSYRTDPYTLSKNAYCIIEMRYSPVAAVTDVADLARKVHITRDISANYDDWNIAQVTDVSSPYKSIYAQSNRYNPQYKVIVGSTQTVVTKTGYRSAFRYKDEAGNTIIDYGWVEPGEINSHRAIPGAVLLDILFEKKDGTAMVDSTYATKADAVNANCDVVSIETFGIVKRVASTQAPNTIIGDIKAKKSIRSIAHQGFYGFSGGYGNNMAQYYEKAAKYGFDYGECDIKFSSDNVPVCCHDATFIDEDTGTTITIANHTIAELKTYNYHGGQISTFEEIVKTCKVNGIGLYIDHLSGFADAEHFGIVTAILKKHSFEKKVVWLVNSGSPILVGLVLAFDKRAVISVLCDALNANAISYATGIATDYNEVHINFQYSNTPISTIESLVGTIPAGITLETYTVDGYANYRKYLPYVSGITSNRVCENFVGRYL